MRPKIVTYKGVETTIPDLARAHGKDPQVVYDRLNRGWDMDRSLNEPVQKQKVTRYEWRGKMYTAKQLAKIRGDCSESTMCHRLEIMDPEEAMTKPIQKKARVVQRKKTVKKKDPLRSRVDTTQCESCQYRDGHIQCGYALVENRCRMFISPPSPHCTVYVKGKSLVRQAALKRQGLGKEAM